MEIGAIFKPMLDSADAWRDHLLSIGTPVQGNVRFAVAIQDERIHTGQFLNWPLDVPIEAYAIDLMVTFEDENFVPVGTGFPAEGADAIALRELRTEAIRTSVKGSQTEGWIAIDGPGNTFYEVVVADVLPYEDETGVVPRIRQSETMR